MIAVYVHVHIIELGKVAEESLEEISFDTMAAALEELCNTNEMGGEVL